MRLGDVLRRLEEEQELLLQSAGEIKDLYRSLAESIRTLTVPFRRSFSPDSGIKAALNLESSKIQFLKHTLQSSEGEVQNDTRWLAELVNNLYAIRNTYMTSPRFIELKDIADIRRVHADIRQFLEELYLKNTVWILQDPTSEASVLARQKRKDIEDLLKERIDPFFEKLEQVKIDEYCLRLRLEISEDIGSMQNYRKTPEKYDVLIKERCNKLGLSYDPELTKVVLQDLELSDESLEKRIREKYEEVGEEKPSVAPSAHRRYLRVLHRYLARTRDVAALLPILENIYYLYQPKPGLAERIRVFFARLSGREWKTARKDVDYSYIIGGASIERKAASLEALIAETNRLEKLLLKVGSSLHALQADRKAAVISVTRLRTTIDSIRGSMRRVFQDCFGLIQWLGKKSNQEKLARLPVSIQRDLNAHTDAIYATLIVNSERLKEIARRQKRQNP